MVPAARADDHTRRGLLAANRWLLLRRSSQVAVLAVFMIGPWAGIWIVEGNLASSVALGVLPLTDPFVALQSLFAGHALERPALIGALIVTLGYLIVGGRAYCAWVCPVNVVTDAAEWLRRRLNIKTGKAHFSRTTRYWLLGSTLLLALLSGSIVWELVNPVSLTFRGLVFGVGLSWSVVLAVFLFDLLVSRRGWCGHLCPVGGFYSLLGRASIVRVSAAGRERCNNCMDCFVVCPEAQVIKPALKGFAAGRGPVILSGNCTNCGRCIDVCSRHVFEFSTRFGKRPGAPRSGVKEVAP